MSSYDLQINGQAYTIEAEVQMPLLWVLRDLLGLTGTKFSCGAGLCSSCTVLIDGDLPARTTDLRRGLGPAAQGTGAGREEVSLRRLLFEVSN